jgi:hypothetical protein
LWFFFIHDKNTTILAERAFCRVSAFFCILPEKKRGAGPGGRNNACRKNGSCQSDTAGSNLTAQSEDLFLWGKAPRAG